VCCGKSRFIDIALKKLADGLLGVDLFLEIAAIELHKFVGISGVAILAAKFAAAIGIDGPVERDAIGIAMIQDGADWDLKIFGAALGVGERGGGGKARDAHQWRIRPGAPAGVNRNSVWRRRNLIAAGASG
jgi:hypothetical protein